MGAISDPPEDRAWRLRDRLAPTALEYEIPPVATRLPYFLGALTLTSIALAAVTGIYLSQLYQPSPIGAHGSVVYIVERAPLGDLTRSLHWWSAQAAILAALFHLSWVFCRGSYRPPRELTWWAGVGMLGCLFLLFFSGTTLPNDQEGFEALAHNLAAAERLGPLGIIMTDRFTPSAPLIARIYALHVSALPLVLVALLGLHLYLIRYLGIHTRAGEPTQGTSFRRHFQRIGAYAAWLSAGLVTLAVVFPRGLGHPAVQGMEVTKPPLPFLWIVAIENGLGIGALAIVVPLVFVALLIVPLVDRRRTDSARGRRLRVALIALGWMVLTALTVSAWLAPQQQHLGM
jgi:quinol-cytochrome oxidoreductase complex cytochrome b subunit